jgi:hypothetical protein
MEFTIQADGVEVLDVTFGSLAIAESFFRDDVIDLGADFGPNIDLTFGYTLIADGPGGFGFDLAIGGAVPEPSTSAMMLSASQASAMRAIAERESRAPPKRHFRREFGEAEPAGAVTPSTGRSTSP